MEFLRFWWHCLLEGWHVGEGCFAWIEGICFLVAAGLRWHKKHSHHKAWEEKWEPKIMKWAFAIFVMSFLISTVFVAPFVQFQDSEKEKKKATDELAKLTPMGAATNYPTMTKLLTEKTEEAEKEKTAKIKAEEKGEDYRKRWLTNLVAITNTSTALPILDEAIAIVRRDMTNNDPGSLSRLLQGQRDIQMLEKRKGVEESKERVAPYYALFKYAASEYQDKMNPLLGKCAGVVDPIYLPTLDWFAVNQNGQSTNTVNAKCNLPFEYSFRASLFSSTMRVSVHNAVEFQHRGGQFVTKLVISGEPEISRVCSISERANCIENINYILSLFVESEKSYFK